MFMTAFCLIVFQNKTYTIKKNAKNTTEKLYRSTFYDLPKTRFFQFPNAHISSLEINVDRHANCGNF